MCDCQGSLIKDSLAKNFQVKIIFLKNVLSENGAKW